ncbi:tetratricopeptide repeat protein 12-like isoform X2 [Liolophura sinensis]|uniref:tetratricopeptide repeat protein 12-like isoform X2 n=1 Tax=Liolophura sinensis TaxID=3198878 RepID=UPI00315836A8
MEGGADIESFLNKVEEIESIVKGLNSSKDEEVKVAVQKADEKLAHIKAQAEDISSECKTGVNRTVINKSVKDEFGDPKIQSGMSQELFMKAMEDDAKERAQRRKVNEKAATKLKEEGNEEFKSGNYEKAVELYSKALNKHRDSHVLYTNRAMALIKLQKYQEALSDCDWALRAFPNATKAFVHQGKAYLALGNFDEARNSYKQGLQTDPKKKKVFEDYLAEVDRVERAKNQEEKVQELFDSGSEEAGGLVELLEKVKKADQLPLFYAGGFRVIAKLLTGEIEKTLFRTQGGLRIHVDHQTVQRCLSASPRSLSQEELDLLSSVLELLSQACFDNETSQEQILEVGNLPAQLPNFLDAKLKGQGHHLKEAIVSFLHCLSLTNVGRCKIVQSFELSRLTNWAFACTQSNVPLAVNAVGMLNNLALDQRFRQQMRDVIEDQVVPAFEALIEKTCGSTLAVLPSRIHTFLTFISSRRRIHTFLTFISARRRIHTFLTFISARRTIHTFLTFMSARRRIHTFLTFISARRTIHTFLTFISARRRIHTFLTFISARRRIHTFLTFISARRRIHTFLTLISARRKIHTFLTFICASKRKSLA